MEIVFYIFLIAAAINIIYLLSYAFALQCLYAGERSITTQLPPVSIVIAARNEYQHLQRLIPLLLRQKYDQKEIIVVNDRSTDLTTSLYSQYPNVKWITVDTLPENVNGKKHALQQGINEALYELILLTDADCIPSTPHWISSMMHCYDEKTEIVCGISMYNHKKGFLNRFIQFETILTAIRYASFTLFKMPYMAVGRNLSYKKNLFKHDPFLGIEHLSGGDDDLFIQKCANRTNTRINLSAASITYSTPKNDLKSYFNQKYRHLGISKHYKQSIRLLLGLEAISSLLYYILGIILVFSSSYWVYSLVIFTARTLILFLIFIKFTKLIEHKKRLSLTLMEDIFYQIYNWFLGSVAYFRKTTRWK